MKDKYKHAKDANKLSGECFNKCPYFDIFDEVLGTRDSIIIPHLKKVGTLTQQSSEGNLQSSSKNPSRHDVESE